MTALAIGLCSAGIRVLHFHIIGNSQNLDVAARRYNSVAFSASDDNDLLSRIISALGEVSACSGRSEVIVLSCGLLFRFVEAAGGRHENLEFRCISRNWESKCFMALCSAMCARAILLGHIVALHFGLRGFRCCRLIL